MDIGYSIELDLNGVDSHSQYYSSQFYVNYIVCDIKMIRLVVSAWHPATSVRIHSAEHTQNRIIIIIIQSVWSSVCVLGHFMKWTMLTVCVRAGEHTIIWYKYNGSVIRYYHLNKRERKKLLFSLVRTLNNICILRIPYSLVMIIHGRGFGDYTLTATHIHPLGHITTAKQSRYMAANDIDTICALLRLGIEEWIHSNACDERNHVQCFSVHTYIRTFVCMMRARCTASALKIHCCERCWAVCVRNADSEVYGSFLPRRVLNLNQFH